MRYVFIGALMWLTASARLAEATGICENNPRSYDSPVRYSATEKRLAFEGSQDFCNEKEQPPLVPGAQGAITEERGTLHFIEIRDLKNAVVERLSSARGQTLDRLNNQVGEMKTVLPGKMDDALKARGFVPVAAAGKSPAGGCAVRTGWKSGLAQNGFPAGTLTAEVLAGKKVAAVVELGLAAQKRSGEAALRVLFVPDEKTLLIWARVPQCIGGPPPGYFSHEDPGYCYPGDEIAIATLPVTAHPELASCFKPAMR